jgi:hypothetical protein
MSSMAHNSFQKFESVLKGQFNLAQWQRLGKNVMKCFFRPVRAAK